MKHKNSSLRDYFVTKQNKNQPGKNSNSCKHDKTTPQKEDIGVSGAFVVELTSVKMKVTNKHDSAAKRASQKQSATANKPTANLQLRL